MISDHRVESDLTKRAALYVRVSTDRQTVENQIAALSKAAEARGWQIVETFNDAGISGAKGRADRPGLDEMLKQAQRGKFDVVLACFLELCWNARHGNM
jgi:DNA invertase Pin-like site-specific DNA recombinase